MSEEKVPEKTEPLKLGLPTDPMEFLIKLDEYIVKAAGNGDDPKKIIETTCNITKTWLIDNDLRNKSDEDLGPSLLLPPSVVN
jgi:hypothetical protein